MSSITSLNFKNFAKAMVSGSFTGSSTSFTLSSGHGSRLPSAPFRFILWNATDYADPADAFWASKAEICECTVINSDTLTTVTRHLEGTSAISSQSGKTYQIIVPPTAEYLNETSSGEINVLAYGAVGDGETDDTDALREAFEDAKSSHILNLPKGIYKITKPIYVGEFTSSQNGQGSFSWGGETKYWGGNLAGSASCLTVRGVTDNYNNTSEIRYAGSGLVPMIVLLGGRDIHFEAIQLQGHGGAGRATEGIFATAGIYGLTFDRVQIGGCVRDIRIGNAYHHSDDPITFSDYEDHTGYPYLTGGWMVEGVLIDQSHLVDATGAALSMETSQCIHCLCLNVAFAGMGSSSNGIFFGTGKIHLIECDFTGSEDYDIYFPSNHAGAELMIDGGHSESTGAGYLIYKDRTDAGSERISLKRWNGGKIQLNGSVSCIIEDCSLFDINLGQNTDADTVLGGFQILEIKKSWIDGIVGSTHAGSAPKVIFSAEDTIFHKSGVTTPWNSQFALHKSSELKNCQFTGTSFNAATIALSGQTIIGSDLTAPGGFRQIIDGWEMTNVPANQSATLLYRFGSPNYGFTALRAGSITGISIKGNENCTHASLIIEAYISEADSDLEATLTGGNSFAVTTIAKDLKVFNAGDLIQVYYRTSSDFTPSGSMDIEVVVEIET